MRHFSCFLTKSKLTQNEPRWPRRATLPPPKQPTPTDMNVWCLIKDFVNKGELSKIATPVQFLEPLSELQQRCEDMEYCELLDQVRDVLCGCLCHLSALPARISHESDKACLQT